MYQESAGAGTRADGTSHTVGHKQCHRSMSVSRIRRRVAREHLVDGRVLAEPVGGCQEPLGGPVAADERNDLRLFASSLEALAQALGDRPVALVEQVRPAVLPGRRAVPALSGVAPPTSYAFGSAGWSRRRGGSAPLGGAPAPPTGEPFSPGRPCRRAWTTWYPRTTRRSRWRRAST